MTTRWIIERNYTTPSTILRVSLPALQIESVRKNLSTCVLGLYSSEIIRDYHEIIVITRESYGQLKYGCQHLPWSHIFTRDGSKRTYMKKLATMEFMASSRGSSCLMLRQLISLVKQRELWKRGVSRCHSLLLPPFQCARSWGYILLLSQCILVCFKKSL